jgi:F-box and leucine-rich repeat protein 2/20
VLHHYEITKEGIASAFREKQTTLRSLSLPISMTPQTIHSLLVSLKGLTCIDLSFWPISDELLSTIAIAGLPLKRIVLCDCGGYSYARIFNLLSKCQSIQHLDLQRVAFLNDHHVVELSSFLVSLVSVNLSRCRMVTSSALFALLGKCPSLGEIKMEKIGCKSIENYNYLMDFGVYPQLKSLYLSSNSWLSDESIIRFASFFPNLHLLDLESCRGISEEGIVQVLRRCCKISILNLTLCSRVRLLVMDFEVPKLKRLNLSFSKVDDRSLHAISKSCCGLLQLLLNNCFGCTEKGVKYVVENCTQLREINLWQCLNVHTNVVVSMLLSRPSLRKITVPSHFRFSESERKLFLRQGCVVC